MRVFKMFLCIWLCSFIIGCSAKKEIINKCEIPNALLEVPNFSVDRELNSQKDYAILLLDIYGAYEKCAMNLKSIKRLNDE